MRGRYRGRISDGWKRIPKWGKIAIIGGSITALVGGAIGGHYIYTSNMDDKQQEQQEQQVVNAQQIENLMQENAAVRSVVLLSYLSKMDGVDKDSCLAIFSTQKPEDVDSVVWNFCIDFGWDYAEFINQGYECEFALGSEQVNEILNGIKDESQKTAFTVGLKYSDEIDAMKESNVEEPENPGNDDSQDDEEDEIQEEDQREEAVVSDSFVVGDLVYSGNSPVAVIVDVNGSKYMLACDAEGNISSEEWAKLESTYNVVIDEENRQIVADLVSNTIEENENSQVSINPGPGSGDVSESGPSIGR